MANPNDETLNALVGVYVYVLPTVMPDATVEPLTDNVKVLESDPYFVDVTLMDVTLDFAAVTGTAVNDPA